MNSAFFAQKNFLSDSEVAKLIWDAAIADECETFVANVSAKPI
jgi:hypothetical protein